MSGNRGNLGFESPLSISGPAIPHPLSVFICVSISPFGQCSSISNNYTWLRSLGLQVTILGKLISDYFKTPASSIPHPLQKPLQTPRPMWGLFRDPLRKESLRATFSVE